VATLSYISKQAKKQTPLMYEAKVREQAMLSLRKKAASVVTKKLQESALNSTVDGDVVSKKGAINAGTLRKIALAYGGDEGVAGGAVLFLNKTDPIAFGDVRGANEKKPVYEITPDTANPNTGTIKDGGLTVRYCLNKNLTALNGTAQTTAAQKTMFYGVPTCIELDLFSAYEIAVSEDFRVFLFGVFIHFGDGGTGDDVMELVDEQSLPAGVEFFLRIFCERQSGVEEFNGCEELFDLAVVFLCAGLRGECSAVH